MAVEEKVKSIIVEQLGVDANEVTPEASFVDDLGADSLDTVELVMAFEEAFNIEIPDEAAEKIQKVKDAIEYIEKNSWLFRESSGEAGRDLVRDGDLWTGQRSVYGAAARRGRREQSGAVSIRLGGTVLGSGLGPLGRRLRTECSKSATSGGFAVAYRRPRPKAGGVVCDECGLTCPVLPLRAAWP